jgi:O-antigen/teichoic acid export membrane protein
MSKEPSSPPSVSVQFFEGAVWSAARNSLQAVLNLTALAVVARELGPVAYGVFGIAMLVIAVAEMIVGGALTDSIVQRKDLSDGHIDATFWLSSISAVVFGVSIAVFALPLARLAGGAQAAQVLSVLACLLPIIVGSRVPLALLARDLRFRVSSQISALATILSCGTGIVLALRGTGIWTLVFMEAVRASVNLIGGFVSVKWRPGRRGRWQHLRELSHFNASTLATYSVGYADMLLPRLLVSHLMGVQALGLFMLAMRVLSELSSLLTEPLRAVAMAACARTQDARDELHRIIIGLYRTARLVVFPTFLGMAVLAPYLIPWLFGPRWEPAVPAVQILMLSGLRGATGAFNAAILFGVGRPQLSLLLFGAGCVLHLIFIPLLAPWGVVGASIAILGRQFGNWPLACLVIKRATGLSIRRQIGGGLPVLIAAVTMATIVWLSNQLLEPRFPTAAIVLAGVLVGAISYVAALRVLTPSTLRTAISLVGAFVRRDRVKLEAILTQTP